MSILSIIHEEPSNHLTSDNPLALKESYAIAEMLSVKQWVEWFLTTMLVSSMLILA